MSDDIQAAIAHFLASQGDAVTYAPDGSITMTPQVEAELTDALAQYMASMDAADAAEAGQQPADPADGLMVPVVAVPSPVVPEAGGQLVDMAELVGEVEDPAEEPAGPPTPPPPGTEEELPRAHTPPLLPLS